MQAHALLWLGLAVFAAVCAFIVIVFIWRTLLAYRRDAQFREYEAASTFGCYQLPPDLVGELSRSTTVPRHSLG